MKLAIVKVGLELDQFKNSGYELEWTFEASIQSVEVDQFMAVQPIPVLECKKQRNGFQRFPMFYNPNN